MAEPLLDLALLLFGAKIGGSIFSRLKQPIVAGELIAGIILGPSLLGIVNVSNLVEIVSQLGLIFLVLLISLGVDWRKIENEAESYVWIEILRIFLTVGITFIVGHFLGWDFYTTVIIGTIVFLSSLAIASRTLADLRQLDSSEGETAIGLQVVDEIVAIVSIALLANFIETSTFSIELIFTTLLIVVGFFVVVGRLGKFVNALLNSIQKYGIEEALLGFTLLVAFLLASITETLNLATFLGIFIAGMIMSKSSQAHLISKKVKEAGESFFVPIFFASIGIGVNVFAISNALPFLSIILAIVLGAKFFSGFVAMKIFRHSNSTSVKVSSTLIPLSEVTLIIVSLAAARIENSLYSVLVVSFVIMSILSPFIISAAFRSKFPEGNGSSRSPRVRHIGGGKKFKFRSSYG